jgi:hypothetical protein
VTPHGLKPRYASITQSAAYLFAPAAAGRSTDPTGHFGVANIGSQMSAQGRNRYFDGSQTGHCPAKVGGPRVATHPTVGEWPVPKCSRHNGQEGVNVKNRRLPALDRQTWVTAPSLKLK